MVSVGCAVTAAADVASLASVAVDRARGHYFVLLLRWRERLLKWRRCGDTHDRTNDGRTGGRSEGEKRAGGGCYCDGGGRDDEEEAEERGMLAVRPSLFCVDPHSQVVPPHDSTRSPQHAVE